MLDCVEWPHIFSDRLAQRCHDLRITNLLLRKREKRLEGQAPAQPFMAARA